jgi:hypothetical protein
LTDRSNAPLLQTILGVISESEPRLEPASLPQIIGGLHLLVQWMFVRSIYRFGSLQQHHFREFIEDSAKGLDHCISATPRLRAHLETLKSLPNKARRALKVRQVFSDAGIPPTHAPRLPHLSKLVREFTRAGHRALAKASKEPVVASLTQRTLRMRAVAIDKLWEYRENLVDPIQCDPFPGELRAKLMRARDDAQQTKVAPESIALKLYIGAMDTVMNIAPVALDWDDSRQHDGDQLSHDIKLFENLQQIVEARWRCKLVISHQGHQRPFMTARTLLSVILPLACQVVIWAYVGRRKVEVESLQSDCISGTTAEGRHLSSYIAKRQSYESRPCPEVVARAVEVMGRYHGYAQDKIGPLFVQRGKKVRMRHSANLDQLAKLLDALVYVDANDDERNWHWAPHQLRRLYVIIYIWRYEDSSYLALRHHLGHGSEAEAAYYARLASDGNFAELAAAAGIFTIERLREVVNGDMVGAFANVIAKRVERIRASMKLVGEAGLEAALSHLVNEEKLLLHGGPWGYCACKATASNLRRAKCRQGDRASRPKSPIFGTPIPEDSEEETCDGCHFFSTGPSRKPHWQKVTFHTRQSLEGAPDNSIVAELLRQRQVKLDAAYEKFFGTKSEATDGGQ